MSKNNLYNNGIQIVILYKNVLFKKEHGVSSTK